MNHPDSLEEAKLLLLLEGIDAVLADADAEELLGVDMLKKFADIQWLIREWLRDESALTPEQRVSLLTDFTDAIAQRNLSLAQLKTRLH